MEIVTHDVGVGGKYVFGRGAGGRGMFLGEGGRGWNVGEVEGYFETYVLF